MSYAPATQGNLFGETGPWVAWRKPSEAGKRAWQIVAQAESYAECSDKLHAVMTQTTSGNYDSMILPVGRKP